MSTDHQERLIPVESQAEVLTLQTAVETAIPEQSAAIDEVSQPNWLRKHGFKVAAGLFLGGAALTMANHESADHIKDEVVQAAPWAIGAVAATETLFLGGAALMVVGAGKEIGNPLTLFTKKRFTEVLGAGAESQTFKTGLAINTVGALGSAAVVAVAAATSLPKEMWPGAFGLAAADMASTVGLRSLAYGGMKKAGESAKIAKAETEKPPKVTVRKATFDDIDILSDIDLKLFEGAYGDTLPEKDEVIEMLTKRLANNPGWMFVAEMRGVVRGFVTGYRTNVSAEEFSSWEHSTNNGTLEGKVDPNGRYGYVVNMTIEHEAVELGAREMLLANLFANGVEEGIEYGYFEARMPGFKRWLIRQQKVDPAIDVSEAAQTYYDLRRDDGKARDPQLKMYEGMGFERVRLVPDAFEDDASMNYGVVFKADVPPSGVLKKSKLARKVVATGLRLAAKNPKVLNKVF